jgi:hypothetical protein
MTPISNLPLLPPTAPALAAPAGGAQNAAGAAPFKNHDAAKSRHLVSHDAPDPQQTRASLSGSEQHSDLVQ